MLFFNTVTEASLFALQRQINFIPPTPYSNITEWKRTKTSAKTITPKSIHYFKPILLPLPISFTPVCLNSAPNSSQSQKQNSSLQTTTIPL